MRQRHAEERAEQRQSHRERATDLRETHRYEEGQHLRQEHGLREQEQDIRRGNVPITMVHPAYRHLHPDHGKEPAKRLMLEAN